MIGPEAPGKAASKPGRAGPHPGRPITHEIIVSPHVLPSGHRHPRAVVVRLAGAAGLVLCVSETPASSAAMLLLERGVAKPFDTIIVRSSVGGRALAKGRAGDLAAFELGRHPRNAGKPAARGLRAAPAPSPLPKVPPRQERTREAPSAG